MRCIIITGGDIKDPLLYKDLYQDGDHVICVDGGIRHLHKLGWEPDVVLGDFDSCNMDKLNQMVAKGIPKLTFPAKKDKTDTELAMDYAVSKKPSEIIILGAIGTRLDHTLANIHIMLQPLEKGVPCSIINENNKIHLMKDQITLHDNFGTYVSAIPLSGVVKGVTTKGLLYPLKDYNLEVGSSLGISNKIISNDAGISIQEGLLIVIQSKD